MAEEVKRVMNFSAGPSVLPEPVLKQCQEEIFSYQGCGQSVMEMSHRSKIFQSIYDNTEKDLRELLEIPDNYRVFFLQGGATMQFSAIPLNFNIGSCKSPPVYIVTGGWSHKAANEAKKFGNINIAFDSGNDNPPYTSVPNYDELKVDEDTPYLYLCTNETVHGVKQNTIPNVSCPIVADMSSCFMSEPVDVTKYGIIYAGAQKNVGPAGLTLLIIREDLINDTPDPKTPVLLDYRTWAKKPIYNTPPCWSIYVMGLVMKWLKNLGGLIEMEKINIEKAKYIYDVINNSNGYYISPVNENCRSLMNIRFRIKGGDEFEKKFISDAELNDMFNLKGHKSLGGCRASVYNAQPIDNCRHLAEFMKKFMEDNPCEENE